MDYPWHEQQWQQLRQAAERGQLHHAMLLAGVDGLGIAEFASRLVSWLLCDAPGKSDCCGRCKACLLLKVGNHPDLRYVRPEEEGGQVRIEAMREMIEQCQLSSQYGKHKIAVIIPAEAMNRHSANSLLKTLEEPPASALLILVSHQPARLPATILSRCQRVNFTAGERALALDWLRGHVDDPQRAAVLLDLAGGAPLKALALDKTEALQQYQEMLTDLQALRGQDASPVRIAEKWLALGAGEAFTWLLSQFAMMAAARSQDVRATADEHRIRQEICRLAAGLDLSAIISCYQLALQNHRLLGSEMNVNKQGLLETLIVHWQSVTNVTGRGAHVA